MSKRRKEVKVIIKNKGKRIIAKSSKNKKLNVVIIINNQYTRTPNTTQIASGAGKNSAAGSNAAIDSSNTDQQQSVGANGLAKNIGMQGEQTETHTNHKNCYHEDEVVVVINNQINKSQGQSSATQVASGSGTDSAGGTNAAIGSSNTKQQHAVGGDGRAINRGENGDQEEE